MKKRVKIGAIIVFLFIIVLLVFAGAFQVSDEIKDEKVEDLELIKKYNSINNQFTSFEIYDYISKNKKSKYKVQIIGFDNETKLDSWIRNKVEESVANKTIKGNVIFLDKNKNFVFWRNGISFIQIINIRSDIPETEALREIYKPGGSGVFAHSLIDIYLEQFPSDCSVEGCISKQGQAKEKIRKSMMWFFRPPEGVKSFLYYEGADTCPITEEEWSALEKSPALDAWEIEEEKERCNKHGKYVGKDGQPMPNELKVCGKMIDDYLAKNNKYVYNQILTLQECLLREKFLEDNKGLAAQEISEIFEKRNEYLLNEMKELDVIKNRTKSKELQERLDKFVEDKIKERNRVHGFNVTNEKSKTEVKNMPLNNTSSKRPMFVHYWFER